MTGIEVKGSVNTLGSAWDQFKKVNDARLGEIERKGNADPLFMEQLTKISDVLDGQKRRLDSMETIYNRPAREVKNVKFEGNTEYKKAFDSYIRKGSVSDLESFEKKSMSIGSDTDGGYLVTPTLSQQISKYITSASVMRELASVEEISSDSLDIIIDNGAAEAGWVAETGARDETDSPQVNKKSIATYELYAQPKATQKLVDDSAIDIEAWLAEKVSDIFAQNENNAFIVGDGSGKPKGILSYAAGTAYNQVEQVPTGTSAVVTADSLVNLYFKLKDDYARNATFLMNRSIVQSVRLLKEATTNQYLWQPGLALGAPDTLMGITVRQSTDMPVAAASSLSVVVGDFKRAYKIVDRLGVRILRDPFTDKPFVNFYTTKRVGGEVVNFEALKILKLAVS